MINAYSIQGETVTPVAAEEIARPDQEARCLWIDLVSPTPQEREEVLEKLFHFHPLAIEDCVSPNQYPKVDDYGSYLFVVMHGMEGLQHGKCQTVELHAFLGPTFLVTYHDRPLQAVERVRERLQKNGAAHAATPARLLHALLDEVVEQYYPSVQKLAREIDELESLVFAPRRVRGISQRFRTIKSSLVSLRQTVRLQRDVLTRFARGEFKLVPPELVPYFRDVADALLHVDESTARFSEELFLSLDVYLNKVSNETNEIIKLLTVLTAITTPATVIGTWYGMNFHNMPELQTHWGYAFVSVLTLVSTLGLVLWLKSKRWL